MGEGYGLQNIHISLDELVLELGREIGDEVVCCSRDGVRSTEDGTEVYHEEEEIFSVGLYLDYQSSDLVVEVHDWRLVFGAVCIFGVCILVCVVIVDGALVVPGRNDIDMVVR
jgi:hypothetical protein